MEFKTLKDKCRYYQSLYDYKLMPNGYIIAHLDGKNFSGLIKNNFEKPFDEAFINMMNETAKYLCNNVQDVKYAFAQSDEISLFIKNELQADLLYGGRLCKLQSILASMATSEFNKWFIINKLNKCYDLLNIDDFISKIRMAQFDCKVWNVPNFADAKAWFIFRLNDCIKNSKQQTAQTWCTHKELLGKTADEQVEYLKEKYNIDWSDFSETQKYGRFFIKNKVKETKEIKGNMVEFERSIWEPVPGNEIITKFSFE